MNDHARKIADTIANSLHLAAYLRVIETHDNKVVVSLRDGRGRFVITVTDNEDDFEDCA